MENNMEFSKDIMTLKKDAEYPRACEALGYCPYNNKVEGFPCPDCPHKKHGGYSE